MLFHIVYVSSASQLFTKEELVELMQISARRNAEAGLSGLLLYKDGNIIQVLEGEEQAVRASFERIKKDPRHRGVIVLAQEAIEERSFPRWGMGFRDLNSTSLREFPEYNQFLNTVAELATRSHSLKLLSVFKQKM
jgi:ribosomal protein L35AE/L33A